MAQGSPSDLAKSVSPSVLWPANHELVSVAVGYSAADNCGPVSSSPGVTSDEPIDGTGDGDTAPDRELVGAHHVRLRAERAGPSGGRVYTIIVRATDGSGNSSSRVVTVSVPKNKER